MKNGAAGNVRLLLMVLLCATAGVVRAADGTGDGGDCGAGEPQRLCASAVANTRATPASAAGRRRGAVLLARADPELAATARQAAAAHRAAASAAPAAPAAPAASATETGAAAEPVAGRAAPIRIALLLPTRSATLTQAAEAVRAGFMAGAERDGAGVRVDVVSTGDALQDALDAYARAAAGSDIVVGPLTRSAVTALAGGSGTRLATPTLALNTPEGRASLPQGMVIAGLSVEDEARQLADWAAREHPHGRALVLTGSAAWAQRAAGAFEARWNALGHTGQRLSLPTANDRIEPAALDALRSRVEIDPPDLVFAALDVAELRRVRAVTGKDVPCYAGSAANPGRAAGNIAGDIAGSDPDSLDGLRLLDLPWMVRPDEPAVMAYPRPLNTEQPLDMDRLYALGIDAFLLARQLALHPQASVRIDGVTGRLVLEAGAARVRREEAAVIVHPGVFEPVDAAR